MVHDAGVSRLPHQNSSFAFVGYSNFVSCYGTLISDSLILQVLGMESKGIDPQVMGLIPSAQSEPSGFDR